MKPHHLLFLLSFTALMHACQSPQPKGPSVYLETETYGLSVPVLRVNDTMVLQLADFYVDPSSIDSVTPPAGLDMDWSVEDGVVRLWGPMTGWLNPVMVHQGGHTTCVFLKQPATSTVHLEFDPGAAVYKEVHFVGDINGWSAGAHPYTLEEGKWVLDLTLNPGGYAYRIEVDGTQQLDPSNPDSIPNGFGAFNSVLKVAGPDSEKVPHLKLENATKDSIELSTVGAPGSWIALWQNQVIDQGSGTIRIGIPAVAKDMKRSFIRVWSETTTGLSNEVRIPLEHGQVVSKTSSLDRNDKERNIMYFMMVDRFVNGDSTNDDPVEDERILPRANYYGGDLSGIQQKIDDGYFAELGVNTIWISPITQNPLGAYQEYPEPRRWFSGYHGYWPVSFKKVDHRFGSNEELKELVEKAHSDEYNIILDYVCNHVHENHPIIQQHPEWKTDLVLPDGRRNLRLWDEQRLTTWFDDFLPTLDFSIPEVTEVMSDSAIWWIESFGFDGFRHDATKHIPESFWRETTLKLRKLGLKTGKNYFQVGETFGSRELIQSYIGSGMMDGQFDFNLYFDAVSVFKDTDQSMEKLATSLLASQNLHGSLHLMCNITGNHDLTRFISLASGAISDDEDPKEAGWSRHIKVEDSVGYDRLKMLQTFIMTIPGIPVIYYGDEIGMAGGNDPDNRRMMRFDLQPEEQDVKAHVAAATSIRAGHMALLYGDLELLEVSDQVLAYRRTYLDDQVVTMFNNSADPRDITVPALPGEMGMLNPSIKTSTNQEGLVLSMPPFSSQIIYTK